MLQSWSLSYLLWRSGKRQQNPPCNSKPLFGALHINICKWPISLLQLTCLFGRLKWRNRAIGTATRKDILVLMEKTISLEKLKFLLTQWALHLFSGDEIKNRPELVISFWVMGCWNPREQIINKKRILSSPQILNENQTPKSWTKTKQLDRNVRLPNGLLLTSMFAGDMCKRGCVQIHG